MKQPTQFKTDKQLQPGTIYQLQQGTVKVVCSKGSAERLNLTGHWVIVRQFENEIIERDERKLPQST